MCVYRNMNKIGRVDGVMLTRINPIDSKFLSIKLITCLSFFHVLLFCRNQRGDAIKHFKRAKYTKTNSRFTKSFEFCNKKRINVTVM